MLRSMLSVVGGYAATAALVMTLFALVYRGGDTAVIPGTGFLIFSLA